MIQIVSIIVFLVGYILISQEHFIKVSKTAISLVLAVVLWSLVAMTGLGHIQLALIESGGEIFGLVIFLLSAMTLVEILTHYGLFNYIYSKLAALNLDDRAQFFIITFLTFIFSSFLDNLTTTIVFLQISRRFFKGSNLVKSAAAIVIAANAGGVFSPIGDVTTTMLWLAGKFSAQAVFLQALLPSLTVFIVSALLIGRTIKKSSPDLIEHIGDLGRTEWLVISICLLSFLFPLFMTLVHLPPYLGLLLGLGVVWLIVDIGRIRSSQNARLSVTIEKFFQKTDIASLYFFIGILLAISALSHLGILAEISNRVFTNNPSDSRIIAGNIAIGGLSAVFDNIPLTAAAIEIIKTTDTSLWVLLALTVGVGGSLLLIGSAPGIIAMAIVEDLTFKSYFKIASFPALIAFIMGILVWLFQYNFLHQMI